MLMGSLLASGQKSFVNKQSGRWLADPIPHVSANFLKGVAHRQLGTCAKSEANVSNLGYCAKALRRTDELQVSANVDFASLWISWPRFYELTPLFSRFLPPFLLLAFGQKSM